MDEYGDDRLFVFGIENGLVFQNLLHEPGAVIGFVFEQHHQIGTLAIFFEFDGKDEIRFFFVALMIEIGRLFGFEGFPLEESELEGRQCLAENVDGESLVTEESSEKSVVDVFFASLFRFVHGVCLLWEYLLQGKISLPVCKCLKSEGRKKRKLQKLKKNYFF